MLLANKTAVIYGAGGSLGGAIARAFAAEGATVWLSGRHRVPVAAIADDIVRARGNVHVDEVDALDEESVRAYVDKIEKAGSLDISYNAIGLEDTQSIPLVDMTLQQFVHPIEIAMRSHFLTSTAAGRVMSKQGSGVILSVTATPGGIGYPMVGGFGPACVAIERFMTDLACELGPRGVRVVNLRSAGSPDSRVFRQALDKGDEKVKAFLDKLEQDTMLKSLPKLADIANVATFIASDRASKITGVTIDVTAGTTAALNRVSPRIPFGPAA